jgi:hypothetical protein
MDDSGIVNTWRAMCPADYARLREAALHRAEALRREASLHFWRQSWALARRLLCGGRAATVAVPAGQAGELQRRLEA